MEHYESFDEAKRRQEQPGANPGAAGGASFATIGTFDGVHRGHQAILTTMAEAAHAAGAQAVVVTFHPHPIAVLRGLDEPYCLSSPQERARLLGETGVDTVITLQFDRALASLTAEEFMQQMSAATHLRQLWVGSDFALGRGRAGTPEVLGAIGAQLGYSVHITPEVALPAGDGPENGFPAERISSSAIRKLVREGRVARAAEMLGRPYAVEGPVEHGEKRGRLLGFPTANVSYWPDKITPAYGVYATWAWLGERRLPSVTSVGVRPTFHNPPAAPRVEAYLMDFNEDLYGQQMRVEFLEFLRPELRFQSAQELIDQMILDTANAREVLAHAA